jgi:hypothetical protein
MTDLHNTNPSLFKDVYLLVVPRILVEIYRCFRGACVRALMTIGKTSVNFHQTRQRSNPEDSHLYTLRRENLNSDFSFLHVFIFTAC